MRVVAKTLRVLRPRVALEGRPQRCKLQVALPAHHPHGSRHL